jgi:hypothetical protein
VDGIDKQMIQFVLTSVLQSSAQEYLDVKIIVLKVVICGFTLDISYPPQGPYKLFEAKSARLQLIPYQLFHIEF